MKKLIFSISVLFILATACTSYPTFPKEETVKQELMPLQGITNPFRLDLKSPFLIIMNNCDQREDSLFHIYNLENYELTTAFGNLGRGPGELLYPTLYTTHLSNITISDMHDDDLTYRFEINPNGTVNLKKVERPKYMYGLSNASFINDSLYVIDDFFFSPNLHIVSFNDELPKKSLQYGNPAIINRFIDPDRGNVYANNDLIVFSYSFKKQIDFMDTNLNFIKRVIFKYDTSTNITEQNQFDVKTSYRSGYLGRHYFYTLYRGISHNEKQENLLNRAALEVFDLNGNTVIKYNLEGLIPDFFVVDENTFTLYGGRYDGVPEDYLLVYKLKGLS